MGLCSPTCLAHPSELTACLPPFFPVYPFMSLEYSPIWAWIGAVHPRRRLPKRATILKKEKTSHYNLSFQCFWGAWQDCFCVCRTWCLLTETRSKCLISLNVYCGMDNGESQNLIRGFQIDGSSISLTLSVSTLKSC